MRGPFYAVVLKNLTPLQAPVQDVVVTSRQINAQRPSHAQSS